MIFISKYGFHYNLFDWEMYLTNYRHIIDYKFDTKDKVWWHFLNIGETSGYTYFDINKREINKSNFDWKKYSINNPYIVFQETNMYQSSQDFWNNFIAFNTNIVVREQLLQNINRHRQNLLKKKNILYYVGVTCRQNFNTGIQRVTRQLSNYLGNTCTNYNIFLIKFDININDFVLINESELNTLSSYNGYNHLKNRSFEEKQQLFQKIKNISENVFILPELFYTHDFDLLDNIINIVNKQGFKSIHIYHDDTIYNNLEMDKIKREEVFNKYIYAISKFDIIIPNSGYSEKTYLFHKNRLQLNTNTNQIIQHVSLAGEMAQCKRVTSLIEKDNYIFSNISICERKNARTLIKAFNLLNETHPYLKLIICGEVYDDNAYYKSFKKLLNNNIIFISKQSDEKIIELYKKCLFSVYPSIEEGFGLPIYESLWNNSPVICHNATSTLEIANEIDSDCVKCIDCLNETILFETMKQMLNHDYLDTITEHIKNIKIKTWHQYGEEIMEVIKNKNKNNNKKTIYYYIDHTSSTPVRTGIQILTIYLAKKLLKMKTKYNFNLIFVKWDQLNFKLTPSTYKELIKFFINNDEDILMEELVHNELYSIDTNNLYNCIFFCPEVPLIFHEKLSLYLIIHNFTTVYILHDIIPLVLEDANYINERTHFYKYFNNIILRADKIIGNSEFTKNEFLKFCTLNDISNHPPITSVLLPYQCRDTKRVVLSEQNIENSKITILLPGSIEPRKQQLLVMELFNKLIKNNPFLNVELIVFGHSTYPYYIIEEQIKKSGNKIKYLGIISNKEMIELYKNATFTCFLSKYEGYGLPVAESLWYGKPVLTSCLGSMAEVAGLGGCYCINAYNPSDIYDALCILTKNPKIILKLKEDIMKTQLISWDEYAEKIYTEICDINFH